MTTPETQFKQRVTHYLDFLRLMQGKPVKYTKIWGGGKYQKAGIPDIIACVNGIYFEIELKSQTGKPSELQEYQLQLTNAANGFGILLYPSGFDQFKKLIKEVMDCDSHTVQLTRLRPALSNTGYVIMNG